MQLTNLPSPGQTISLNHDECGDSRGRLRITGKPDGAFAAYCHNCNAKGCAVPEYRARLVRRNTQPQNPKALGFPDEAVFNFQSFPMEGRKFLLSAGLTLEEIQRYKIAYNPTTDRVILPGWWDNRMVLRQDRRLSGDGPKYLTLQDGTDWSKAFYTLNHFETNDTIVIVEDILSAIRCARLPNTTAVACLSTGLTQFHINHIVSRRFQRACIFLDNDNAEVNRSVLAMKKKLLLCSETIVDTIFSDRDPKEHHTHELLELIRW